MNKVPTGTSIFAIVIPHAAAPPASSRWRYFSTESLTVPTTLFALEEISATSFIDPAIRCCSSSVKGGASGIFLTKSFDVRSEASVGVRLQNLANSSRVPHLLHPLVNYVLLLETIVKQSGNFTEQVTAPELLFVLSPIMIVCLTFLKLCDPPIAPPMATSFFIFIS